MKNPRQVSFEILMAVLYDGAYSNIAINKAFTRHNLPNQDRGFVTELVYGTISQKIYLEHIIQKFSKVPIQKISKEVMVILLAGIYQLRFMDSVTDFAAVDESVKLCKKVFPRGSGFVNGLLRNLLRDDQAFEINIKNKKKYLSVKYAISVDIVDLLINQYGEEEAVRMLKSMTQKPDIYIRVNGLKTDRATLMEQLTKDGIMVEAVDSEELAVKVSNFKRMQENTSYQAGLFTVQDLSSMKAVRVLGPKAGDTVLDTCAAPGGKTTFMAELMENQGKVEARDISERKLPLIEEAAKRLGINIINTGAMDAAVYDKTLFERFDKILVDAPCSGLGIIRRKPELRYKKISDIEPLYKIQSEILENASKYLKDQGILVYSTCTINKKENEEQVQNFLSKEAGKAFHLLSEHKILFGTDQSDGFYIAKLKKSV